MPDYAPNLAAKLGDKVIEKLVEAGHPISIIELETSFAEMFSLSLPDSYRVTRAAVADLQYLRLVDVNRGSKTVQLTPKFHESYGSVENQHA